MAAHGTWTCSITVYGVKRKIVIGIVIYSVLSLVVGYYTALTIRTAVASLNKLIDLHHVETLREHYLIQIKMVQSDLALAGTHFSRPSETVLADIGNMRKLIDTCFDCHHSPQGMERLNVLKQMTDKYIGALNRIRLGWHLHRPESEEATAFLIGEELIKQVRDMIDVAVQGLNIARQSTMSKIANTMYTIYAILVLGPLLSALFGYLFILGLTHPVTVLLESCRKLQGGDLDHRVMELSDEFGVLADSFNEMADSLKEQMEKRRRSEQLAICGELAAGLTHEIKNPLAGIKAAVQILDRKAKLSEKERGIPKRITWEIGRLETLIDRFLSFAKPPKLRLAIVNVNRVVDAILSFHVKNQSIQPNNRNGILITKDFQSLPETMADPVQLQQIVLNIVLNAVDSMPNGGTLNVRTSFDDGQRSIGIEIADTGKGINPENAVKIFEPFFTTKSKGSGLGLAVSKRLLEQHGGSITVAGNSPGGSIFRICLPWHPTEAANA